MQWSQGEKASAMINAGRQFLDRQDYSAKVDRARQSFATDNYADFAGISSGSRTANSRVFANADAVQSAVRESEGRSRSYSEVASRAENLSFDEKTKLTQGAVDYLYRTAIGKQGLYGHPIDRADMVQLLNPTGADAGTWTQLRQELLGPWLKQQTDQLLQSAAPVQDFPARTDLGRATDAMDTRDSTAGARPRNSRLSRSDGHGGLKTTKQGTERVSDQPIAMPSANWDPLSAPRPNLPSEAARAANAAAAAGRLASERTGRTVKDAKKLDKFNQGKSNSPLQVADDE
jgi:hypothetical protein